MPEKEIGKLLELLNEYDGDVLEYGFVDGCIRRRVKNFNDERNSWKSVIWYTKEFGFIQRLVEQDKIDHAKLSNYFIDKKLFGEGLSDLKEFEILLMALSISEQPIELLISILK